MWFYFFFNGVGGVVWRVGLCWGLGLYLVDVCVFVVMGLFLIKEIEF